MTEGQTLNKVRSEYEEGRSYLEPKKTRWTRQLMMLNNLQRGDQNIASTTLYSYFNRVFSSLYSNTQTVKFVPGNDSELYASQSLNKMAISDSQEMDKPMLDYDWIWDACFYGAGYVETLIFDKKRRLMRPVVINPMFFQYDPYFSECQQWRYYDKWVLHNHHELELMEREGLFEKGVKVKDIETGVDPYIWTWHIQAELAKDVNPAATETLVPSSEIYQILEHYTYIGGKKHVVWTNRSITKIIRIEEIKLNDDPDHEKESLWPIVRKYVFREPHSSATISVPDLIEDKHRALNVIYNLAYEAAKDEVNPLYLYDPEKIKNPAQLFQRQIKQHIAVNDLDKAMTPVRQKPSLSSSSMAFINTLKSEAAEVIGTAQPPALGQKGKKSATQDAMMQQIADLAQSLQAKLIANGEAEFWAAWYQRYINNIEEGDIKMIAITDAMGTTFEQIELDKIKTKYPPRIIVSSAKEAEYKETVERRELAGQLGLLEGVMAPPQFKLFLKNVYLPKFKTFDQSSIDLALPKTIDEMQAEQENDALTNGEWVDVQETDDHETHLYIHARAKNTAETWTHRLTHQYALAQMKKKQEAIAAGGGAPTIDESRSSGGSSDGGGGGEAQPKGSGTGQRKPSSTTPAEGAVPNANQKNALQPTQ